MFEKICLNCGKNFKAWRHEEDKGGRKFCSKECTYAFQRKHWPSAALLNELYLEKELSQVQIAKVTGCPRDGIMRAMKFFEIPRRTPGAGAKLAYNQGRVDFSHHRRRENHPYWNGGRVTRGNGYIALLMPEHHRANKMGYVLEHIVIWEKYHKKPLPDGWIIHHLNGITNDNRPENLVGMPDKQHKRVLSEKAKRIQQLEDEIKKLRDALNERQLVFLPD